jgi:hypothetical protein
LFVVVKFSGVVNQVLMTIYAFLLIAGPGIDHVTVRKHGTTFVWNIKEITMAFLTLVIFERGIGLLPLFFVVILALKKMNKNVFSAVPGFGIEEIKGIMRSRQMAIHAVGHKSLFIVNMSGGLPGIVGKLNLVAGGTELGRGCAHHSVVGETEQWKGDNYTNDYENGGLDELSHGYFPQ